MSDHLSHFDRLYRASPDPWDYERSASEAYKRRVVAAMLGTPPLGRVVEIGCGPGVATAALAPRCARLLAIDGSDEAVRIARERMAGDRRATVRRADLPCPLGRCAFDAAVATEVLYYLPLAALRGTLASLHRALRPGGRLVATSHLERFADAELPHARLTAETARVFGAPRRIVTGAGWRADLHARR